jgi:hypothetical protein
MKKLLQLTILLFTSSSLFSQSINSQNFNSLALGNIGTDITGASPGLGGLYTQATNGIPPTTGTNAGVSNFQIVNNDATHGKVLQIIGTDGDKGERYVWLGGFPTIWAARNPGSEILEFEYEFYTGAGGGSKNLAGVTIYDSTGRKFLGGLSFNTNTLALSGLTYYLPAPTTANPSPIADNYMIYLGSTPGANFILTANTWVRVGVSFNKSTGKVIWKAPGLNAYIIGASASLDPYEIDFMATSGTTATPMVSNTSAATILIDNFVTRISATDTLLQNDTFDVASTNFSVSPNPANDFVTISNSDFISVNAISITDLNGRVVKQITFSNVNNVQVNVSDLSSGVYMMTISSDKGSLTKKFIKN